MKPTLTTSTEQLKFVRENRGFVFFHFHTIKRAFATGLKHGGRESKRETERYAAVLEIMVKILLKDSLYESRLLQKARKFGALF